MGSDGLEPFEHQVDYGDMHPSFTAIDALRIVVAQPPASAQPGQSALNCSLSVSTSKWWLCGLRLTTVSSHPPVAQAHDTSLPV